MEIVLAAIVVGFLAVCSLRRRRIRLEKEGFLEMVRLGREAEQRWREGDRAKAFRLIDQQSALSEKLYGRWPDSYRPTHYEGRRQAMQKEWTERFGRPGGGAPPLGYRHP